MMFQLSKMEVCIVLIVELDGIFMEKKQLSVMLALFFVRGVGSIKIQIIKIVNA